MLTHKGMTPMEARRRGGMSGGKPGEAKSADGMSRPHDEEMGGEDHNGSDGDGMHHHEMHEHEDGSYSSKHTHPDGRVTEMTHDDYDSARDHMDDMHGESGDEQDGEDDGGSMSHDEPDGDEGEDLSGMYSSD